MWVERPVSQVGVHLGYSSGGVFPVEHLAGWVELTLLWVCLGGQDSDWVIAAFSTSRSMADQEETSANNLSEDDLSKEKLHSGISGVSAGMPLRTSPSFLLSIWVMTFSRAPLLPEVLVACLCGGVSFQVCVCGPERVRRAEGGPRVSLGVWSVTVFLSGYATSPWQVSEFLKRDPFSFFLFWGRFSCGYLSRCVCVCVCVCDDHLSKGPASTCLQCVCVCLSLHG